MMGAMNPFDEAIDFAQPREMPWPRHPESEPDREIDAAASKPAKGGPRFVDRKELQTAIDDNREGVDIAYARGGYPLRHTFTVLSMPGAVAAFAVPASFQGLSGVIGSMRSHMSVASRHCRGRKICDRIYFLTR
jgi:hypothetical protein